VFDRDPFDTRLVFNRRFSPLLTDIGKYQAKSTVLKPNFAALVIDQFSKAGLEEGDTIAISMTGSMPGANIAVLMACETMNLHYVSISSMGASEWGATDLNASWPRMEKILYDNKLIKHTSNKFAYGGSADYVKIGSKSRQDYGGLNQREKLDSLIQSIYPNAQIDELLLLRNLDSNNDQFSVESNKYLSIGREYYALPISIARRLEDFDFVFLCHQNHKPLIFLLY
jgi:poly-gamma-glutamate system protein